MKTTYLKSVIAIIGSLVLMSGSCKKKEISCDGNGASYISDVKSIVDKNCIGCHEGFSTYEGLIPAVNSGKFEDAVINKRTMPQGGKLEIEELIKIKCWLDNGAKEN